MLPFDWLRIGDWFIQGLISGLFAFTFGALGAWVAYRFNRKQDLERWEREHSDAVKHQLRAELTRGIENPSDAINKVRTIQRLGRRSTQTLLTILLVIFAGVAGLILSATWPEMLSTLRSASDAKATADIRATNDAIQNTIQLAVQSTLTAISVTPTSTPTPQLATPGVSIQGSEAISVPVDFIDFLSGDNRFTSLVKALKATGLNSVLKGRGPFTLFAPSDSAFAALPRGAFEQLLSEPGGQLKDILLYHIISGKIMTADMSNNLLASTLQGKQVKFTVMDGNIRVNSASIIQTDIQMSNGVIHVIDTVILPPAP